MKTSRASLSFFGCSSSFSHTLFFLRLSFLLSDFNLTSTRNCDERATHWLPSWYSDHQVVFISNTFIISSFESPENYYLYCQALSISV
jgi:hypothetical protein